MSYSISITFLFCILFSWLSKNYSSFVIGQHPILNLFVEFPPDIEIKLLYKYGSIHTIQEYINWSMLEEHIYPTFSDKLRWLVHERTLIKIYLQGRVKHNLVLNPSRLLKSEMILLQLENHILKYPYKVIRGNSKSV